MRRINQFKAGVEIQPVRGVHLSFYPNQFGNAAARETPMPYCNTCIWQRSGDPIRLGRRRIRAAPVL